MRRHSAPTAAALLMLVGPPGLTGQSADSTGVAAPSVAAAPLAGSIRLDGVPDEPAWDAATPAMALTQRDPDEGAAPTERTEIRVLLGGDAVYVGARLHDREPSRVRALLTRRDATSESDRFTVQLDSRDDRRTAFLFELNPRGVRRDGVVEADGTVDYSPDPVWEGAVHQDGAGWSVEMRIPLSQLRYNRGADAWGVQFTRFIQRRGEEDVLSFVPKSERSGVNRFGRLIGLAGLPASRHAEVAPYVSGRGSTPTRRRATRSATAATTSRARAPTCDSTLAGIWRSTRRSTPTSGRWKWTRRS